MRFDFICKKKLCHGKKAVTFAYDIEKNRIIYQNDQNEIPKKSNATRLNTTCEL